MKKYRVVNYEEDRSSYPPLKTECNKCDTVGGKSRPGNCKVGSSLCQMCSGFIGKNAELKFVACNKV